jgi:hypothetical protein
MAQSQYREPPLDKASSRAIVETIVGEKNETVEKGDWIVHKSRVFSGNVARAYLLIDLLESLGCVNVWKVRNSIAGSSIGFSKEVPPYGMRGEAVSIITQQALPKKETIATSGEGLLRRGKPAPQQPQPQLTETAP